MTIGCALRQGVFPGCCAQHIAHVSCILCGRCCAGDRGLRATRDLQAGQPALLVPRRCSIWTFSAATCPFPEWIDAAYFNAAPITLKLALCLLHQRSLGSGSVVREIRQNPLNGPSQLMSGWPRACTTLATQTPILCCNDAGILLAIEQAPLLPALAHAGSKCSVPYARID